ncbi:MAG: glycosyltransferase family 4 protein [Planctomycetales bacterium]|nr:glycosyltransferase family 4 protein [Planctomycetales bacterium]
MTRRDIECLLLPVYTPIRTDEPDVSTGQVFFGGINVYLQQKLPLLGRLPRPLLRWLDAPWLLRWVTKRAVGTQAEFLGDLSVSMLQGTHGHQAAEVQRLVAWLSDEYRPDVILLTNLLIGGCIPEIRKNINCKIFVWLQGDDIFLDHLPAEHRKQATALMSQLATQTDACLVNSDFYATYMSERLSIPRSQFRVLPLAIDTESYPAQFEATSQLLHDVPSAAEPHPLRLGYFARIAPEKGLHHLVDAFIELAKRPAGEHVQLHYGGWLGDQHRDYLQEQQAKLEAAGLAHRHVHHGSPDRVAKIELLQSLDLFCVPTDYHECKGLYVLEALAAGVPVVQPAHGAFPELIQTTAGGRLYEPGNKIALVDALESLIVDHASRRQLAFAGHSSVHQRHSIGEQATRLLELL